MLDEKYNKVFYEPIDREEYYEYILWFVDNDDLLEKRLTNIFKLSPWLSNYTTREDIRQDVIVDLFSSINTTFPRISGVARIKYFNTCVKNVLSRIVKSIHALAYPVLDENLDYDRTFENENEYCELIYDIFLNENLEYYLVRLLEQGYTDKKIMEMLDLGRRKYKKIKDNIKKKLRENGYVKDER